MSLQNHTAFGCYVVADPEICGGEPTFSGTRILVRDVLFLAAQGYDWQRISVEYDGRLTGEAIAGVLFVEGRISSGKAAQLLDISRLAFLDLLRAHGVAYVNYSPEELADEFAASSQIDKPGR
jgi:uncharacterized protein (DUF433 family)